MTTSIARDKVYKESLEAVQQTQDFHVPVSNPKNILHTIMSEMPPDMCTRMSVHAADRERAPPPKLWSVSWAPLVTRLWVPLNQASSSDTRWKGRFLSVAARSHLITQ